MRITVKKHHQQYLQNIANQMNVDDASEALNLLLWELRKINYAFGSPLPQYQQVFPVSQTFDPSTYEKATAMSALSWQPQSPQAIGEFEQLQQEVDPIIARMALLVDEF